MTRPASAALACALATLLATCTTPVLGPTAADAEDFVADAEARLLSSRTRSARADWVRQNFVTADTTALAAEAAAALAAETAALARAAARFDGLDLPAATARKLARLRAAPLTLAPDHPAQQRELADLQAGLERTYRAGAACAGAQGDCLDQAAPLRTAAELRDTDRLLDAWDEGRALTPLMRRRYERLVEIANAGAMEMGHADAGERWRSAHALPPDTLRGELDRLWNQVRPLYESLHCLVRGGLGAEYGTAIAPPGATIPAHLLGDAGSARWSGLYDLVAPRTRGGYDLTRQLARNRVDPPEMVRYAERFFASLGFDPLPATFHERSRFVRPAGRDVVCSPGAWNVDGESDVRIRMCITVGRRQLRRGARRARPRPLPVGLPRAGSAVPRRAPAMPFSRPPAIAVALSVTPGYVVRAGAAGHAAAPFRRHPVPAPAGARRAGAPPLRAARRPLALAGLRRRGATRSATTAPGGSCASSFRASAPRRRSPPADFDPGTIPEVAANAPLTDGFLAGILRFQLHRALCAAAGVDGPLHRCSVFGSRDAGTRLRTMMEMGASRPPVARGARGRHRHARAGRFRPAGVLRAPGGVDGGAQRRPVLRLVAPRGPGGCAVERRRRLVRPGWPAIGAGGGDCRAQAPAAYSASVTASSQVVVDSMLTARCVIGPPAEAPCQ